MRLVADPDPIPPRRPEHPLRERKIYRGEALRAVAMPLGGLGTGSIALCGDGSLRQWQIQNQVNHMAYVPHSFFAIWTRPMRSVEQPIARVLQSKEVYDLQGPLAPPTSNDHWIPAGQRKLLERLPGVQAIEFTGEYPIATLDYKDADLPVKVQLEAFNPFIPLEAKNSGLPCILFNFTVTNPTQRILQVSALATLQNAVGWDGTIPIFGNRCFAYDGNSNSLARLNGATTLQMGTTRLSENGANCGSMALSALASDVNYMTQWDDLDTLWGDFSFAGALNNSADSTPSPRGRTWNGALAVPFVLRPGESRTVPFLITWYFPNRIVNYSQLWLGVEDEKTKFWIGNQYSHWFNSALDVAEYVTGRYDELVHQTRLARDTFHDTTLPRVLVDTVTSQMSILRSPTCFWGEDGRFYGFEGCSGSSTPHAGTVGGCCPLNCTHVWNYEMALARLFPELERTMRDVEWDIQQHPTGYLPHRVVLPLYLPRLWDRVIGGPDNPALDGLLGAILKSYREYRACGDDQWLARIWPSIKRALEYIRARHDPDGTGIIQGEQPNTYDISIYGANTFIGTLYLASLRAIERMAVRNGERDLAAECKTVYERGRRTLDSRLWNGEYYIQEVDSASPADNSWGTGCHSDQLLGQWWAFILGLGDLLDREHLRKAALSIFHYNFRENFRGHVQTPRVFVMEEDAGLLICTWPKDGRPTTPTRYSDEIWTGIEYAVSSLLLFLGQVEPALRMIQAVRARYDGRKQNPWNDIECGDHYVRAMSSWSLLEAATGFSYDASQAELRFAPAIVTGDFQAPFVTRDGWGTFSQHVGPEGQAAFISLAYGSLEIRTLNLVAQISPTAVHAWLDGVRLPCSFSTSAEGIVVTLDEVTVIRAVQTLSVELVQES